MLIHCPGCNTEKDENLFHVNRRKANGRQAYCKVCQNIKVKNIDNTIFRMFKGQIKKDNVEYSFESFKTYLKQSDDFLSLYTHWSKNEFKKDLTPTITTIDCRLPVTLDNILVCTFKLFKKKLAYDNFLRSKTFGINKDVVGEFYRVNRTINNKRKFITFRTYESAMDAQIKFFQELKDYLSNYGIEVPSPVGGLIE